MYYDFTVPIPQIPGKIVFKFKGTTSYVLYQYDQVYKPEKQYVIPQRTIIGKRVPDNLGFAQQTKNITNSTCRA